MPQRLIEFLAEQATPAAHQWRGFCAQLADRLSANCVGLLPFNEQFGDRALCHRVSGSGMGIRGLRTPDDPTSAWKPWDDRQLKQAIAPILLSRNYAVDQEIKRLLPFGQERLPPLAAILLQTPHGNWALAFEFTRDSHAPQQIAFWGPALKEQVEQKLAAAAAAAQTKLQSQLDLFAQPGALALLLDRQSNILQRQGTVEGLLDDGENLVTALAATDALPQRLADFLSPREGEAAPLLTGTGEDLAGRGLQLAVMRLPEQDVPFFLPQCALAWVAAHQSDQNQRFTAFADRHRLTQAERKTLGHLIEGWPTKRIASAEGVQETTIRQRLKAIYLKCEVNAKAELIVMTQRALSAG